MKKEYTTRITQVFDENMDPVSGPAETITTSLIAESGMVFRDKRNGFVGGIRIDLGTADSEENYEEVKNPYLTDDVVDTIKDQAISEVEQEVTNGTNG